MNLFKSNVIDVPIYSHRTRRCAMICMYARLDVFPLFNSNLLLPNLTAGGKINLVVAMVVVYNIDKNIFFLADQEICLQDR